MRTFEIRLYDRRGRWINSLPCQVTTRGQAAAQARMLLGGVAARYELEEL